MLTTTTALLSFVARTTFVSCTGVKKNIIPSHDDGTFEVQMTRNTFERVKNAQIHCIPLDSERRDWSVIEEYYPVNANDCLLVQKGLALWTSLLHQKSRAAQKSVSCNDPDWEGKNEVARISPKDVEKQFGGTAIWKMKAKNPLKQVILIVAREISLNLYEWSCFGNHKGPAFHHKDGSIDSLSLDRDFDETLHFVSNDIGVKKLAEISSLFAEQRTQQLQHTIATTDIDQLVRFPDIPEEREAYVAKMRRWQESFDKLIGKPQCEKQETAERDAIQSKWMEESKWLELIDFRAAVSKESTRWQSEVNKMKNQNAEAQKKHQDALLQEKLRGAEETERLETQLERMEDQSTIREQNLENRRADTQRELDSERILFIAQLDERQQAAEDAEQKLRDREEEIDGWITISMFIGGGVLTVVGLTIFVAVQRGYNEMSDDMEYELNAQLKRVKEPHPLVPEYPSAHANRLGVHEHPAVRDVFGMKEPWDVTPGEGFHVSRITKGGRTPGTTRAGTDEGVVRIDIPDALENEANHVDVVEEDPESDSLQNEGY